MKLVDFKTLKRALLLFKKSLNNQMMATLFKSLALINHNPSEVFKQAAQENYKYLRILNQVLNSITTGENYNSRLYNPIVREKLIKDYQAILSTCEKLGYTEQAYNKLCNLYILAFIILMKLGKKKGRKYVQESGYLPTKDTNKDIENTN